MSISGQSRRHVPCFIGFKVLRKSDNWSEVLLLLHYVWVLSTLSSIYPLLLPVQLCRSLPFKAQQPSTCFSACTLTWPVTTPARKPLRRSNSSMGITTTEGLTGEKQHRQLILPSCVILSNGGFPFVCLFIEEVTVLTCCGHESHQFLLKFLPSIEDTDIWSLVMFQTCHLVSPHLIYENQMQRTDAINLRCNSNENTFSCFAANFLCACSRTSFSHWSYRKPQIQ